MKNMTTKVNSRKSLLLLSVSALISVTALPVQAAHAVSEMKMTMKNSMTMKMPMTAANSASSQKSETIAVAPAPTAKSAAGAGGASSSKGVLLKYQVYVGSKYSNRKVTITVSDKQIRNGAKLTVATVSVDKNGYAKFTFPAVIGPNDTVTTTLSNKQGTTVSGTKVQLVDAKVTDTPVAIPTKAPASADPVVTQNPAPTATQSPTPTTPTATQSAAPVVVPTPTPTHTRVAIPTPSPKPTASAAPTPVLLDAFAPVLGRATATNDGYIVQIANFDPTFSYVAVDSAGGRVYVSPTGQITVTNLNGGVTSSINVTTKRSDHKDGSASSSLTTVLAAPAAAAPAAAAPVVISGGGSAPAPAPAPTTTKVTLTAIPGVTPPVVGMTPVFNIRSAQYTGTVAWSPAQSTFDFSTAYTAVITLTPASGYTLAGVSANAYTVAGGTATNAESSGVITVHFPTTQAPGLLPVTATTISGITLPVFGATPVTSIVAPQYVGSVVWSPQGATFAASTVYTATITLTPATNFTLTGVAANAFTVAGGTATNAADSGVITVTFPSTGAVPIVVGSTPQLISIVPVAAAMRVGAADQVITASSSSGLALTVTATGACTAANGSRVPTIHATSAGTCTVAISQPGDTTYAPAATTTITVTVLGATDFTKSILTIDPNGGSYNGSTDIVTTVVTTNLSANLLTSTLTNGAMTFQGWRLSNVGGPAASNPFTVSVDSVLVAAWA